MEPVDLQKALVLKTYKEMNTIFYSLCTDLGSTLTHEQQLQLLANVDKKMVNLRRLLMGIINRGK